jgi:hypothetical protein
VSTFPYRSFAFPLSPQAGADAAAGAGAGQPQLTEEEKFQLAQQKILNKVRCSHSSAALHGTLCCGTASASRLHASYRTSVHSIWCAQDKSAGASGGAAGKPKKVSAFAALDSDTD